MTRHPRPRTAPSSSSGPARTAPTSAGTSRRARVSRGHGAGRVVTRPAPRLGRGSMVLDRLAVPIVLAPLAGGPTTPELAAAVSNAGGLGFLAAGYLSTAALRDQIARARALTSAPLGVNLFVPGAAAPAGALADYAAALAATASQAGVDLGEPRFHDDDWPGKVAELTADPVPVVSFTFGC